MTNKKYGGKKYDGPSKDDFIFCCSYLAREFAKANFIEASELIMLASESIIVQTETEKEASAETRRSKAVSR